MSLHTLRRLSMGISLLVAMAMVSACATTSPAMRFYLLSPISAAAPVTDSMGDSLVVVGPLQLPGYLDRPQLVLRQADGRMSLRELDRWAEPLDDLFASTVTANLVQLTGSPRIAAFPLLVRAAADLRILGRVTRFDADFDGLVTLVVQWSIVDGSGEPRVPVRIDTYRAEASGTDPTALVAALSDVVAQFSRQVAAELAGISPDESG